MNPARVESYTGLCHGTTASNANQIKTNGFLVNGDNNSWCGPGVYFYIDRAKAYWAAQRKCNELKSVTGKTEKPTVVVADIENVPVKNILDLRRKDSLELLNNMIQVFDKMNINFTCEECEPEEKIIKLRSMYISFYCVKNNIDLVIGNFYPRNTLNLNENVMEFARAFNIIYGAELIFCAKNKDIISNIR